MDLAYSMFAALHYGHASAWIWWQGSDQRGLGQFNLMVGTSTLGKRYFVSKQFFRFIRPGARMVKTVSSNSSVFAAAFEHTSTNSFTALPIKSSAQPRASISRA